MAECEHNLAVAARTPGGPFQMICVRCDELAQDIVVRLTAELQRFAEYIDRSTFRWPKDGACVDCYPNGDALVLGFQCVPHRAIAIRAAIASRIECLLVPDEVRVCERGTLGCVRQHRKEP